MEERHQVRLLTQSNGDLGVRMHAALGTVFTRGYRAAVLIGTDVPAISRPLLSQALILLDAHDVVLGPAVDGGYYLLGLKQVIPELFDNMPWSSDRVCRMTEERARTLRLKTALLPRHRDLDTVQDLVAILQEAGTAREARGDRHQRKSISLSNRTEGVLRTLTERIGSRPVNSPAPIAVK
jgi:rSAM/selenodomain-associated transferase 1